MIEEPEPKPWDRLPEENDLQFAIFDRFRVMGPGRTLVEAQNSVRKEHGQAQAPRSSGSVRRAADKHHWRKRAALWDSETRAERNAYLEVKRQETTIEIVEMLVGQLHKLAEASVKLDTGNADFRSIDHGMSVITKTLREVLGQTTPSTVVDQSKQQMLIINLLKGQDDDVVAGFLEQFMGPTGGKLGAD